MNVSQTRWQPIGQAVGAFALGLVLALLVRAPFLAIEISAPLNGAIRSVLNALAFAAIAARSSRELALDMTALPAAPEQGAHAPCDPHRGQTHDSTWA